ncbi:hypothetical protein GWK08_07345 [Leptobacterium flavescens]|uniref:O-antigen ligase domain-containing protein n=1 Tax=Leptobacterium flavescens TaxID=472055 RepID=A0A6P0UN23_9FLAO|nr:hypothetical protein [Leptobacterium flavescens]
MAIFVICYLPLSILLNTSGLDIISILKDVKPILFLIIGFVFFDIMQSKQIEWNAKFTNELVKINFYASIIFFLILNKTNLIGLISNDPFFTLSETRYLSMGTFFSIFYFIAIIAQERKLGILQLIYILTPVFLSGNRTFFIILGCIFLVNLLMSVTNVKRFLSRAVLFLVGGIILFLGILNLNNAIKDRILSLFDYQLLITQLTERRFAPFIDKMANFEWYNYIIGQGIGEKFFIPWFVYRANIDNYNVYMDNIYMTLFVKYGLMSCILFFMLFYFINKTHTNKKFKLFVIIYFLIIGFTTSYMYQNSFLFLLLVLAGFKTDEKIVSSQPSS